MGIIGIGTGRCGTKSLAHILNSCVGVNATHERHLLHWYRPDQMSLNKLVSYLKSGKFNTEVNLSLLPRVEYLYEKVPDLKVVHIYRDKDAVVKSFYTHHGDFSRIAFETAEQARRHSRHNNPKLHELAGNPDIFPTCVGIKPRESYEFYWDFYIKQVGYLKKDYPIFELRTEDLNGNNKLSELYTYLEIPEYNRVFPKKRKYNVTKFN